MSIEEFKRMAELRQTHSERSGVEAALVAKRHKEHHDAVVNEALSFFSKHNFIARRTVSGVSATFAAAHIELCPSGSSDESYELSINRQVWRLHPDVATVVRVNSNRAPAGTQAHILQQISECNERIEALQRPRDEYRWKVTGQLRDGSSDARYVDSVSAALAFAIENSKI